MSMSYVKHKKQVTRQYVSCAFCECFTLKYHLLKTTTTGIDSKARAKSMALTPSENLIISFLWFQEHVGRDYEDIIDSRLNTWKYARHQ